eukprot:TRINITY_DN2734_c0_g1_i2.p1 TRINITY_DN2734_c0_g1~~TRINITY_DN2734_c0_g1_i2.p1  ORF type:complete len:576 (+),score=147.86 TRINITY_DN2734_c0_g1_i2:24-1751(+)
MYSSPTSFPSLGSRDNASPVKTKNGTPSKWSFREKRSLFGPSVRETNATTSANVRDYKMISVLNSANMSPKFSPKRKRDDSNLENEWGSAKKKFRNENGPVEMRKIDDMKAMLESYAGRLDGEFNMRVGELEKLIATFGKSIERIEKDSDGKIGAISGLFQDVNSINSEMKEANSKIAELTNKWQADKNEVVSISMNKALALLQAQKEEMEDVYSGVRYDINKLSKDLNSAVKAQKEEYSSFKEWVTNKYEDAVNRVDSSVDEVNRKLNRLSSSFKGEKDDIVLGFKETVDELVSDYRRECLDFITDKNTMKDRLRNVLREELDNFASMMQEREVTIKECKEQKVLLSQQKEELLALQQEVQQLKAAVEEETHTLLANVKESEANKSEIKVNQQQKKKNNALKIFQASNKKKKEKKEKKLKNKKKELPKPGRIVSFHEDVGSDSPFRRSVGNSNTTDDGFLKPLPKNQHLRDLIMTPPNMKNRSRISAISSSIGSPMTRTPSPLKWGVEGKSIVDYYFDPTGDASDVHDQYLRSWAKKERLAQALEDQRYRNPNEVFGNVNKGRLDIQVVFKGFM